MVVQSPFLFGKFFLDYPLITIFAAMTDGDCVEQIENLPFFVTRVDSF